MEKAGEEVVRGLPNPARKRREMRYRADRLKLSVHNRAPAVLTGICTCLLSFVRWFGIPSPFAAAFILSGRASLASAAGLAAGFLLRLIWGIDADVWQYAGCLLVWLFLNRRKASPGMETAALGGLAMIPRLFAAVVSKEPLWMMNSFAALPMAMLFSAALRSGRDSFSQSGTVCRGIERFCMLLICLLTISGLGYFWIGRLNLGQAAAVAAVLVFACCTNAAQGAAGGLLCGLALALSGHDSRMVLSLCLSGFLCGLPSVNRRRVWCILACAAANSISWFVNAQAVPAISWWAYLAGSVLFVLLPARRLEQIRPYLHSRENGDRSMENAFVSQRIAHMQEAIERLARALPQADEAAPSACEELAELLCGQCSRRQRCWGKAKKQTERLLSAFLENGTDEDNALSTLDCIRSGKIPDLAREALMNCQRRNADARKARYEREVTLTHLAALSGTLGELEALAVGENFHDLRAAHVIGLALEETGVPARLSYARRVDGHLQAALETHGMLSIHRQVEQLLQYLKTQEDLFLAVSRNENGRIELEEIPLYSPSVGTAFLCADGADGPCGDACCAKRCDGGRLLLMLCDGMGHGSAANRQSEKTLELLMLLLEAGYTRHQAITAVNGMMLGTQKERFSTVDLADVDLWTGEVYSEKLGACASWIIRGNHMKKVDGSSLPLGIMEEASPTAAQYRLHSGDILVMLSDGVADAFAGETELRHALEESLYIEPQRMADTILRNALVAGGGVPRDDMSVMVLLLIDQNRV